MPRQRISLPRKELLLAVKCFALCLLMHCLSFQQSLNMFSTYSTHSTFIIFYFQHVLNFSTFGCLKFSTCFQHLFYLYRFNFVFSLFFVSACELLRIFKFFKKFFKYFRYFFLALLAILYPCIFKLCQSPAPPLSLIL